ncbi:MAG: MBL fold metallo-hydrolase [Solobacterium sp.]|nr:MBL fold metallo-hydrolase [Solobacterium sp.]
MALYWYKDLGDNIYKIEGQGAVGMYLVMGTKKAALLDTGVGIGNLKEYVETLTDLPVEVYLTHGHMDHAGGIYSFDHVYVNERDNQLLKDTTTKKERLAYASIIRQFFNYTEWTEDDLIEQKEIRLMNIEPGDVIDLGGRTLTVIDFHGHTQGSVAFYDDQTKTVFLGDGCNNSTFMFLDGSTDIQTYLQTLQNFKKEWMPKTERLIICHDYDSIPMDCIDNVIECCEKILAGTDDKAKFEHPNPEFASKPARWACEGGPDRLDGKFGNIVYNYERIK